MQLFKLYGVKVISMQEPWLDTEGPMQELLLAVFGWAAAYESRIKSERTRAGQAMMLKKGVTSKGRKVTQLGRPKGSKDRGKRERTGYLLRWAKKSKKGTLLGQLQNLSPGVALN